MKESNNQQTDLQETQAALALAREWIGWAASKLDDLANPDLYHPDLARRVERGLQTALAATKVSDDR